MNTIGIGAAALIAAAALAADETLPSIHGIEFEQVTISSSLDGTDQPAIIGVPDSYDHATPTPLLVGLHTWSGDYRQQVTSYGREAAARGWLLVLPNFRGPNKASNPNGQQAGGSLFAQRDIVDARAYMIERFSVDERQVYLTGDSGGGHMTMLMAGKYPDLWSAAAAWVPVTDLRDWWAVQNGYAKDVIAITGGEPGDSPEVDFEYARRSPRTFVTNLAHLPVLLAHGDRDATIPVEQSWQTFRVLGSLPAHNTLLHVFSGGHTSMQSLGLDWCVQHVGSATPPHELHLVTDESKSYYWATLHVADDSRLATADLITGETIVSIATANVDRLTLDLSDRVVAVDGLTLALRNDHPLVLTLTGVKGGAALICEGTWTRLGEPAADGVVLLVDPSEETRSLTLTW